MRHWAAVIGVVVLLTGCASTRSAFVSTDESESAGYAAPGPDLVGTWRGTAFTVGGSLYLISAPVDLTIRPDGTWSWSTRGQEQGRGRAYVRSDRVILEEESARKGTTSGTNAPAERIVLSRRGGGLWGLTRAFIPGGNNAVDFKRVTS